MACGDATAAVKVAENIEDSSPSFASKVLSSEEMEQLIVAEINKVRFPDSITVAKNLERKHGLAKSVTTTQLKYLLSCGKLGTVFRGGKESLCVKDEAYECCNNEGKVRKISDDEDRLNECREQLKKMADTHEEGKNTLPENMDKNMSGDEDEDQDATSEDATTCNDHEQEFSMGENDPAFQGIWGSTDVTMDHRLSVLERKMEEICKNFMLGTSGRTNSEEMTKKISVLENNNAKLVDENMALKLELKGFIRGKASTIENNVKIFIKKTKKKSL